MFVFSRKSPYDAMSGCMVVYRTNCVKVLALGNVFCSQDYLCDVLSDGMFKQSLREQDEVQDHSYHA